MADKSGGRTAAKAATSEKDPSEKTAEWRDLTFTLPAELPGAVYFELFDQQNFQGIAPQELALLQYLLGPDQYENFKAKVAEVGLTIDETSDECTALLKEIVEPYGITWGNSSASDSS